MADLIPIHVSELPVNQTPLEVITSNGGDVLSRTLLSDIIPEESAEQNNIIQYKTVRYEGSVMPTQAQTAALINSLPTFIVDETTIQKFAIIPMDIDFIGGNSYEVRTYDLIKKGKGTYGTGGTALNESNLKLSFQQKATSNDIALLPSTQIFGDWNIGLQNVSEYVNDIDPPIEVQGQEIGYRLFRTSEGDYLFSGDGGTYGFGALQTTLDQFYPFDSSNPIDPTFPSFTPNKLLQSDANGDVAESQITTIENGIEVDNTVEFLIKALGGGGYIKFDSYGALYVNYDNNKPMLVGRIIASQNIQLTTYFGEPTLYQYIQRQYLETIKGEVNGLAEFNKQILSASFTGDTNKTLTLTKQDGTIITASFLDGGGGDFPDDVINTMTFNANNDGVLYAITSLGEVISVSLDGRYSLLNHEHTTYTLKGGYEGTAQDIVNLLTRMVRYAISSPVPIDNQWHGTLEQFKVLYNAGLSDNIEYNYVTIEQKVHNAATTVNLDMWDKDVTHICKAAVVFNLPAIGTISHTNEIIVLGADCTVNGGIGLVKVEPGVVSAGGNQTIGKGRWKLIQELGTSNYMICRS